MLVIGFHQFHTRFLTDKLGHVVFCCFVVFNIDYKNRYWKFQQSLLKTPVKELYPNKATTSWHANNNDFF